MIKFLQANLHRSRAAHDMAPVAVKKYGVDILVVSEPNVKLVKGNSGWIRDKRTDIAVLIYNKKIKLRSLTCEDGYVVMELEGGTRVLCTYISPNITFLEFRERIEVMRVVVVSPGEVIVMGDLKSKAADWGSPTTDARGAELCDWIAALDLTIHNDGEKPTCITGDKKRTREPPQVKLVPNIDFEGVRGELAITLGELRARGEITWESLALHIKMTQEKHTARRGRDMKKVPY